MRIVQGIQQPKMQRIQSVLLPAFMVFICWLLPAFGREKEAVQYGMGLIVNVPYPEAEVAQVVQDVVQNGIIRGSKEYNKDEYIAGATSASSTRVFPEWTEGGKVFYKIRLRALDPRNFKDSGDVGTVAVRYVVQPKGDKNTVLRIDARYVEDFRHTSHASNGSVEGAEYKDIHDRLDSLGAMKAQAADAEKEISRSRAKDEPSLEPIPTPPANTAAIVATNSSDGVEHKPQPPAQTLKEHVQDLRQQVERRVKSPGAALKSAPFRTATVLQSLSEGTEVLIVISTPYWYGIETHDGQHGWMLRDDLELVP